MLVVLLGHAALLGGALRLTVWRDRQAPRREPPALQVLLLRPPPVTATAAPAPAAAPRRPATQPEPQAITAVPPEGAPGAAAPAPAPTSQPAAAAADSPASAPPAPLDLRLPRRPPGATATRNPALDDPRGNSARPATVESRIAALLGGVDGIVEERLDDGRMRLRRGSSCVVVHPSRAERIDPFNASPFPKMRGVEGC